MALRNRCEFSAMAFSANPTGAKVPVGACFVTFDNRYIAERSWLYLYQDGPPDVKSSEGIHSDDPWMPCV